MQDQSAVETEKEGDGIQLRVISGLQRGAGMDLQHGRYLVGSGENCDVVLTDDYVAEAHLVIEVTDGALKVEACDGPVAVGDKLLQPGEETLADAPLAISLGQTGLGVGDPETDWSALSLPDLAAGIAAAEEAASEDGQQIAEGAGDEDAADSDELFADTQEAAENQTDNAINEDAEDESNADAGADIDDADDRNTPSNLSVLARLKEQKHIVAFAGALGVAVIVTSAFFVRGAGDHNNRSPLAQAATAVSENNHDNIRVRLNEAGITEVDVKRDENGDYRLSGYVADETMRMAMHSILLDAQVSYSDQARQVDEIMRIVQFSLDNYQWPSAGFGQHLILSYVGGGVFAIDGYLGPEVDRTDLNRQIISDAPGVVRIDFKRARLADWQTELEGELERAGLKPWILTNLVDGDIQVSGEVTPKEAEVWRKVGQDFVDKSRGWPKLKIAVRAAGRHMLGSSTRATPAIATASLSAPHVASSRDVNVIGVIMPSNGPGRVLLDNGSSRTEGETLYDDAVLQSISLNKVIIRKGNQGLEMRIGEQG
ncbi:MAG: type III secretion system inner membrane ring subunit SctD [Pseudomonadota bacterium]